MRHHSTPPESTMNEIDRFLKKMDPLRSKCQTSIEAYMKLAPHADGEDLVRTLNKLFKNQSRPEGGDVIV